MNQSITCFLVVLFIVSNIYLEEASLSGATDLVNMMKDIKSDI